MGELVKERGEISRLRVKPGAIGHGHNVSAGRIKRLGESVLDLRAFRHQCDNFLGGRADGRERCHRSRDVFQSINLRGVENVKKAEHGNFLNLMGFLVFDFKLFPENDGASLFTFADSAAKLLRLPECTPVGRFVAHGMKQEYIDATIASWLTFRQAQQLGINIFLLHAMSYESAY